MTTDDPRGTTGGSNVESRDRGRRIMLVVAALFIGPVLAAAAIHFLSDGWRPEGRTNHGELLSPVIQLPQPAPSGLLMGEMPGGDEAGLLRGTWWFVHLAPEGCHAACAEALYRSRQIWLALGRRNAAVRRLLITDGLPPRPEEFQAAHPDLRVLGSDAALSEQLSSAPVAAAELFLVDPAGQLVLVYPEGYEGKGVIEDIKKLLKLTRI